jgi:hypothetical protein
MACCPALSRFKRRASGVYVCSRIELCGVGLPNKQPDLQVKPPAIAAAMGENENPLSSEITWYFDPASKFIV